MESLENHPALSGSDGFSQSGAGAVRSEASFNDVEVLDLQEQPPCDSRGLVLGFEDFPADMRHAATQCYLTLTFTRHAVIGLVAITLDDASEVDGEDALQGVGCTACLPVENHVALWLCAGPKIALLALAGAGGKITHWRFVDLHVSAKKDVFLDLFADGFKPLCGEVYPIAQALAGEPYFMTAPVNRFLPV